METQLDGSPGANLSPVNVRAPSYFLLQSAHVCADCGQSTSVAALAVPADHECTEADVVLDDDAADSPGMDPAAFHEWLYRPEQWHRIDGPTLLSQARLLSASVAQTLETLAPHYRPDPEHYRQWTNFCGHCGKAIRDGALYPSAGQAFSPKDAQDAARIRVSRVDAPFEAFCDMFWTDGYRNKWPLFARLGYECSEAD